LAAMSWKWPNNGSRMNREVHVRFWESPEVKVLRATQHFQTISCAASLPSTGPILLHELTFSFVLNDARIGRPACFQDHRQLLVSHCSPPNRSANAAASSGSEKQNTTTSLSSRCMKREWRRR
jgi:hypothetical protein